MGKELLPALREAAKARPLSRVQRRIIEHRPEEDDLVFQHSVFCQTGLPYRDPGDGVRLWERRQGAANIRILAGEVADPKTQRFVEVGLPWGPKPRLVVAHINAEALRQSSNVIEIEDSLSAFVKRIRGFTGGREIHGHFGAGKAGNHGHFGIPARPPHSPRCLSTVSLGQDPRSLWGGEGRKSRSLWGTNL